jgi:hypothetical protein
VLASIKFSNGQQKAVEIEKGNADSSSAIKLANGWLNDGITFAEAIAAASALYTHCRWAAVSQLEQGSTKVNILALVDGHQFVDCFSYDFDKTPCAEVLGQEKFCHYSGVQHAFPEDKDLKTMGVADYAGVSFRDSLGNTAGHIFVMSDKKIKDLNKVEDIVLAMATLIQLEWPSANSY